MADTLQDTLQASREALVRLMHECRENPRQPEYKDLVELLEVMFPEPAKPTVPPAEHSEVAHG